jgi:hypothetical protein
MFFMKWVVCYHDGLSKRIIVIEDADSVTGLMVGTTLFLKVNNVITVGLTAMELCYITGE